MKGTQKPLAQTHPTMLPLRSPTRLGIVLKGRYYSRVVTDGLTPPTISGHLVNKLFNSDPKPTVPHPTLHHIPDGLDSNTQFQLHIPATNNLLQEYPHLKETIEQGLRDVYNDKVKANCSADFQARKQAWLQLQDYIYEALSSGSQAVPDIREKLKQYRANLKETIEPSRVEGTLLLKLLSTNAIHDQIWTKLLAKNSPPTLRQKVHYILSKSFDFVHGQEILPSTSAVSHSTDPRSINISNPTEWFSEARKMRRHIIMHLGPTNSGKTYRALERLKQVDKGYYGGPLRLLAREVYDKFKKEGIRCNLLTGEEIIEDLDETGSRAGLTSGTIEMIPLHQEFDVVVLDEIQMMADEDRGWAWSNALLGVRAREVHVCGEPSALNIIRRIVKMSGDKLTVNEYERLGELNVERKSLMNSYKTLRKGDCVVAFSKKKILDLKLKIEKETRLKVAVIYGSLPPETRVQQANLFNSGEYDILVASDAIGMGLNLSIDRVIFTTDKKFNGTEIVNLTSSNIKQIGGRAGRYKPSHTNGKSHGYITAINNKVLKSIRRGIESPVKLLTNAIIWPTDEICSQMMVHYKPGTELSFLLTTLAREIETSTEENVFKLPDLSTKLHTISLFEDMDDISFFDKLRLSTAPVKDLPLVKKAFQDFCKTIAHRRTRGLLSYKFPFHLLDYNYITSEKATLEHYESLYNIITLYAWLGNRYPSYFIDAESARDLRSFCELIIFEKLDRLKRNPYLRAKPQVRTH